MSALQIVLFSFLQRHTDYFILEYLLVVMLSHEIPKVACFMNLVPMQHFPHSLHITSLSSFCSAEGFFAFFDVRGNHNTNTVLILLALCFSFSIVQYFQFTALHKLRFFFAPSSVVRNNSFDSSEIKCSMSTLSAQRCRHSH